MGVVKKVLERLVGGLDKMLMGGRVTHLDSQFIQFKGIESQSVRTVAYVDGAYDTRFMEKKDSHSYEEGTFISTIVEVIAGTLCRAPLYDISPAFTLVQVSDKSGSCKIKLKSKLLNNFVTLGGFMQTRIDWKVTELVREKFASDSGIEELVLCLLPCVNSRVEIMNYFKEKIKGSEEFFDSVIKQKKKRLGKSLLFEPCAEERKMCYLKEASLQLFEKFKDDDNSLGLVFQSMIYDSFYFPGGSTKYHDIFGQLFCDANENFNQEVVGAEKLLAAMLLLGYRDFHQGNFGIMRTEHEDAEGKKIAESLCAKVDMSASFYNLSHVSIENYVYDLQKMLTVSFIPFPMKSSTRYYVKFNVDYTKLKEEINKPYDLFTEDPGYITSLVHRALLYKKPLLRGDQLDLVECFVDRLEAQAELLKKSANSKEFRELEGFVPEECYLGCLGYDTYNNEVIRELGRAVEGNLSGTVTATQEALDIQGLGSNSNAQKSNLDDATLQNKRRNRPSPESIQLEAQGQGLGDKNTKPLAAVQSKKHGTCAFVSLMLSGAFSIGAILTMFNLAICISLTVAASAFLAVGCCYSYKINAALSGVGVDQIENAVNSTVKVS